MAAPPVVAVEIGTSKVIVLVGEVREDGHIVVIGMGEHPSAGVRKGEVTDFDHALTCVRAALTAAEETGQVTIHQVHLALSGGHIETMSNRGQIPIHTQDRVVTEEDVEEVTELARAVNLPVDRKILHSIGQIFYVDGERVGSPVGFEGAQLALDMLILHAKTNHVRNSVRLLRTVQQDVTDVAFSGLCSALAVVTPEQKEGGVLVIDLGGGTTTYVAYAAGMFATAGALGLGGDHVTNDIAVAFNIPRSQAERLKREAGCATTEADSPRGARVTLPPEVGYPGRTVSLASLNTVIHLRMSELLNLILRDIERQGIQHQIGAGVVVTGGGARMKGLDSLVERTFRVPCTMGLPSGFSGLSQSIGNPEFATAAGLLRYAARSVARQRTPSPLKGLAEIFKSAVGRKP